MSFSVNYMDNREFEGIRTRLWAEVYAEKCSTPNLAAKLADAALLRFDNRFQPPDYGSITKGPDDSVILDYP